MNSNVFERSEERMLPLYEAKMIHHFDHRWATYDGEKIRDCTPAEKADPNFSPLPRYWVAEKEVTNRLAGRWGHEWLLGWRDITNSTNERTTIASAFPLSGVGNQLPLVLSSNSQAYLLVPTLSSAALDFVARQKVGGTHMNFFIFEQLPVLDPTTFAHESPWEQSSIQEWVESRLLELAFSTPDMTSFASALGAQGGPFEWNEERRQLLNAELDAAFFHLYEVDRDDVDYIMDTFPIVRRKDEQKYGEYRTKHLILEVYDAMAKAIETREPYQTILDPPPGQGPRHPERTWRNGP